jgi:hypothetical protein
MKKIIKWLLFANMIIAILLGIRWFIEKSNTHKGFMFEQREQYHERFKQHIKNIF